MNKHRTYWSVMGYEPSTEKSADTIARERMREDLKKMITRFGFWEVVSEIRKLKED